MKEGYIDNNFYLKFKGKPLEEMAMQFAVLTQNRPPTHIDLAYQNLVTTSADNPVYLDHMSTENSFRNEIYERLGFPLGSILMTNAIRTVKLLNC